LVFRANIDNYNNSGDEVRFKYTAARCTPMDFKEDSQMLLRKLKMYENKKPII